jgi:hypothetical protein
MIISREGGSNERDKIKEQMKGNSMRRPVKLDFKPLSLRETAKRLGVPPARARKILALVGVDFDGRIVSTAPLKSQARTGRASSRRAKTSTR